MTTESPIIRTISVNRRALYDYEVLERYEAGLVLLGTEIKSIRAGQVDLHQAYAGPDQGELWLYQMHISPYAAGNRWNHPPTRPRKLLLHRRELSYLLRIGSTQRLTMIPLRLYLNGGRAKVELALVRGKRTYDRRETIAKREAEREMARSVRRSAIGRR